MAFVLPLAAQDAIRVEVKRAVYENEQFKLSFVVEGEHQADNFKWECPDCFDLVWGPQTGRSSQTTVVNGKVSKSVSSTYSYVLLPRSAGVFTIPPAQATVHRRTISSPSVEVEVVAESQSARQSAQPSSSASSASRPSSDSAAQDMFLQLEFSKREVMLGEPLRADLYLYQNANVAGFEGARFPAFDGFWKNEEAPANIQFTQKRVGDRIYNVALIRGYDLIPQQVGELTVEPAELVCLVNVRSQIQNTGSIFDAFFQNEYETVRRRLRTPEIKVKVNPLPQPAPADFCGGVGRFSLTASVCRDTLTAHEAGSLVVKVKGNVNTSLLEAPKIDFPPDFEVYDVKVTEGQGFKSFEYPFIPRSHGSFLLGPVHISYFDISSRQYRTAQAPAISLEVKKSSTVQAGSSSQSFVGVAARDVKNLGTDIRFISTQLPELSEAGRFFVWSPAYIMLIVIIIVLAAAAYVAVGAARKRRSDVVATRGRAATRNALKCLSRAKSYLGQKLFSAFYEELHRALLGFASDKLALSAADLSKDVIRERMLTSGATESAVGRFVALLDACEFARYAPSSDPEAPQAHYDDAVAVVSELDGMLGRHRKGSGAAATAAVAILLLVPGLSARAQTADELWEKGVSAYMASDWDAARDAWEQIALSGQESSSLYNNIGSACMKQGQTAYAVLYFEKALKLDASNADARYNLTFAKTFCQDRIDVVPEFFLARWASSVRDSMPSDSWAVLSLVLLVAGLFCVLLFALGRRSGIRKVGFAGGIAALLLCFAAAGCASSSRARYFNDTSAVVMSPVCSVRSSPSTDAGTTLFVLHEGTVVRVLDNVGGWRLVEITDGRQGWLEELSLEKI